MNRDNSPSPLEEQRDLLDWCLAVVESNPYPLGTLGLTRWDMIYCKARAKP
jgi:hypothetical protein